MVQLIEANVKKTEDKQAVLSESEQQLFDAVKATMVSALGLPADQVKIKTSGRGDDNGKHSHSVEVQFSSPGFALNIEGAQQIIRERLQRNLPFLSNYVALEETPALITHLKDSIAKATEGTDFDKSLLDWVGFNTKAPAVAKGGISEYAVHNRGGIETGASIFGMNYFPVDPETVQSQGEKLDKQLEVLKPQIKAQLKEQGLYYLKKEMHERGEPAEAIAQAVEKASRQFDDMVVKISHDASYQDNVGKLTIEAYSKEQNALIEAGKKEQAFEGDEIKATNPLNLLDSEVTDEHRSPNLLKAVSKVFLTGEVGKVMLPHAGVQDIKTRLEKEFTRIAAQRPDLRSQFDAILQNTYLKSTEYKTYYTGAKLTPLIVEQDGLPGNYKFAIEGLKQEQLQELMQKLANPMQHVPANHGAKARMDAQMQEAAAVAPQAASQAGGIPEATVNAANAELNKLLQQQQARA